MPLEKSRKNGTRMTEETKNNKKETGVVVDLFGNPIENPTEEGATNGLSVAEVLESSEGIKDDLAQLVSVGYGKDGKYYFMSSSADKREIHWMLSMFQKVIFEDI